MWHLPATDQEKRRRLNELEGKCYLNTVAATSVVSRANQIEAVWLICPFPLYRDMRITHGRVCYNRICNACSSPILPSGCPRGCGKKHAAPYLKGK
jgi:hypothetical protein